MLIKNFICRFLNVTGGEEGRVDHPTNVRVFVHFYVLLLSVYCSSVHAVEVDGYVLNGLHLLLVTQCA